MRQGADWGPAAALEMLHLRAVLLGRIRAFFARAHVLEVDTPAMSAAASTDPALCSFSTIYHGPGTGSATVRYLHTSPEFPMKRLLAAGSGSIYQICKVFRDGEYGALHNPEFTLLEWYRTGYDHLQLMDDVERLLQEVLAGIAAPGSARHWTYRDLFREFTGLDPFATSVPELRSLLQDRHGVAPVGLPDGVIDPWLDLALTHVIQPRLGPGLVFVRDYPASQASLARLLPGRPARAARFEVYLDGVELANGFHELADAAEQRRRFLADCTRRLEAGDATVPVDERLLAALESGLPGCAGVALGVDRLLLIAGGARDLQDVIAFPFDRA